MAVSTTRSKSIGLAVLLIIFMAYITIYILSRDIGDGVLQDVALTITWMLGSVPILYLIMRNLHKQSAPHKS